MFTLPKTTTAKEIQKNYRKIFDEVKATGEPVIVMRNNQPDVVIMDAKQAAEKEAILAVLESHQDHLEGKTKVLTGSLTDLWHKAQKD